jgi:hypothetical protein
LNEIFLSLAAADGSQDGFVKSPFISSPIGALLGYFGARAAGVTGFWETMGLVALGMIVLWFVIKRVASIFTSNP